MSDTDRLLELIEDGIVAHGGDLGGWTRRSADDLLIFDGRITLRAELRDSAPHLGDGAVHAHVLATLHEHDDEVLDACLFGMGDCRDAALAQAAGIWIAGVAGPIRSFLDNRPICMTCQAGVEGGETEQGYSPSDFGLPGLRAFVGPSLSRGLDDDAVEPALANDKPWFRFAAESAAPRRVHLAKATVLCGKDGWRRELEIDGHDVSHQDPNWPAGVSSTVFGYATRFAVFEFPRNSPEMLRRAELERTIRHFAEHFTKHKSVDELVIHMVEQGFDADLVQEAESIGTIALGRMFFEGQGIQYSSTIIRARRDGRIETDVPLMAIPAYSRARALAPALRETMTKDDFFALCLYSAESNGITQALNAGGSRDLTQLKFYPLVVPDRGVSQQTMDAALAVLNDLARKNPAATKRKPWWKFW